MIGLDTNVVVRYIMQDDARQVAKANKLVESLTIEEPGFLSLVSIVELVWVLGSSYELKRQQIAQSLDALLRTKELVIDRAELVGKALRVYGGTSADFADCLIQITSAGAGCDRTMTFDKGAAQNAGMTLIP
ncbi:Predicted nucleic-acid-binding protein, contains PIN domain [Variovorax sp. HW608]|uniref:PIN domain-containing protein n=1 Tax=Variovorax sp. HW608 TaxID=1034889 RepID=UPI00081FBC22|nr:type II toxin-antitoxin system VapC family toxin [Variovorax sp. HW608]SCK09530.1 Predicted nucleic-acid-binding protein, contains PIN domain [Variovorax sp. HW608]